LESVIYARQSFIDDSNKTVTFGILIWYTFTLLFTVVKRDKWARDHKDLFESYARTKTTDYQVASIMLTFNLCPAKIFCDNYETPLPIVWIRDVIENPMLVFDYGNYS
jgi:hypothetical protein